MLVRVCASISPWTLGNPPTRCYRFLVMLFAIRWYCLVKLENTTLVHLMMLTLGQTDACHSPLVGCHPLVRHCRKLARTAPTRPSRLLASVARRTQNQLRVRLLYSAASKPRSLLVAATSSLFVLSVPLRYTDGGLCFILREGMAPPLQGENHGS